MDTGEVVTAGGIAIALFGSIGATVRWAAVQFRGQDQEIDKLKAEYAAVYREHSLVLVLVEHFRVAIQMLSMELYRVSPRNAVLLQVASMLEKSIPLDANMPIDLAELLRRIDAAERDGNQ